MGSLKDALLKSGFKQSTTPKDINKRENIPPKKSVTKEVLHQVQRNYCEECEQVLPDVEQFRHRNPTTEAEWICLRCVDRLKISDECRQTAQSDTSIRGLYKREHGATKPASEIKIKNSFKANKGPANGNR